MDSISVPLSLIKEAKLKQARKLVSQQKDKLQKLDAFTLLNQLSNDLTIDMNALLDDCANALPTQDYLDRSTQTKVTYTQKNQSIIHYVVDKANNSAFLCLNTSKKAFSNYENGNLIRDVLLQIFPKEKQFAQNIVKLPIHDYNQFIKLLTTQTNIDKSPSNTSTDNQEENINTPSVFDTANVSHTNYENMGIINAFDQLSTTTHVDFSDLLKDIKAYAPTMKQLAHNPVYQPKQASQFIYELTDNVLYIYVDAQALNNYSNGPDMYNVLSDNIQTINKFDRNLFIFRLNDKK